MQAMPLQLNKNLRKGKTGSRWQQGLMGLKTIGLRKLGHDKGEVGQIISIKDQKGHGITGEGIRRSSHSQLHDFLKVVGLNPQLWLPVAWPCHTIIYF